MRLNFFIFIIISVVLVTCKDEDPTIPVGAGNRITISQQEDTVSYWEALYCGIIANVQEQPIIQYGHCWDTIPNPDLLKNKTQFINLKSNIEFVSKIEKLQPDVRYYIRAYFIVGVDTVYSEQNQFTTLKVKKPIVIQQSDSKTDLYTAILYGKIIDIGGELFAKGFYYSENPNVTEADSLIQNSVDTTVFSDTLTDLLPNKTYYAKAFASNRAGIGFSDEFKFTTQTQTAQLTTTEPTNIMANSCITGGNIIDDFGSEITMRGVCWSKTTMPTVEDSKTLDGSGMGNFVSEITGLQPNTKYYIRAYAKNSKGVSYGNEVNITTGNLPQIVTKTVTDITAISAISGGEISSIGDSEIISQGICYSTTENPTIENKVITDNSGQNNFTSNLTNLEINTTYFIKAFAENNSGIAYGNQLSFKTKNGIPVITIDSINSITASSTNIYATITDDGGFDITARGFCWSTTQEPTIDDNYIENGTGVGSYQNIISQLTPLTTYYVRAYVINQLGIVYSDEIYFNTLDGLAIISTNSISDITSSTAISGGHIIDDSGFVIIKKGVCWATSENPTISSYHTTEGSGISDFNSSLTNLIQFTVYYVRAYATNENGTSYGENVIFKTLRTGEGFFVDSRDNKKYRYVTIGDQIWMAENLAYLPQVNMVADGSEDVNNGKYYYVFGYDGTIVDEAKATKNYSDYGVLYNWYAAIDDTIVTSNMQGVCPDGWHMPSDAEWQTLETELGMAQSELDDIGWRGSIEGAKLKSITLWTSNGNGTDNFGFTAIPSGHRNIGGFFSSLGQNWFVWSITEYSTTEVIDRNLYYTNTSIQRHNENKDHGFSVRCIKNK